MLAIRDGVFVPAARPTRARATSSLSTRGQIQDAIVGGPKEIADTLEELFVDRGCDGFVVAATYVPGSYADFVRHVVPELQRRGLYHKDYAGKTLREKSRVRPGRQSAVGNSMRWLKFTDGGRTAWGIVEGDRVVATQGSPFGEWQRTGQERAQAEIKIELPLMPRTFYCVGLNYLKHLKEAAGQAARCPMSRSGPRSAIARRTR